MIFASAIFLFSAIAAASSCDVYGFGAKVTGGNGAKRGSIYVVKNFNQFRVALDNKGCPHAPKVIYIDGVVDGNYLPSGELATEAYYAQGTDYTFEHYLDSFNATLKAEMNLSTDSAAQAYLALLEKQEGERQKAFKAQENQIALLIGNNTSIEPLKGARSARIQNSYIAVNQSSNVIFRNLEFHSPIDLFPEWDPTDDTGNWNSKFDTIGLVTANNVLITGCSFSDGAYPDEAEPVVFGKRIMRHDGMIDITEGSDYVTVSYNKIVNHNKAHLIGNNDADNPGPGDKGRLHVTFYGNWWINTMQRSPRVRFGKVHVFNNLYQGTDSGEHKMFYYIGMGINSTILSENNVFEIDVTTSEAPEDFIVGSYKGYNFNDVGSIFNGTSVNVNEIAAKSFKLAKATEIKTAAAAGRAVAEWATHEYTDSAFKPPYKYKLERVKDVKKEVMKKAGQRLNNN